MEISTRNGDCAASDDEDKRRDIEKKRKPPRPPIPEFKSLSVPSLTDSCSSPEFFNHKNPDDSNILFYKLTDYLGTSKRKAFLRSAEHILATFYGVVSKIQGKDWNVLKSDYLPIYFVRVSVKDVKHPFRILVVNDDQHRAVDFIVNCNTKTRISEETVCWEDQETFEVRFSGKNQAIQFHDTISRMISTLKKGEDLKSKNSNKMLELEVHLPNSDVKNYQVLKTDKLENTLKLICGKENLRVNDHYFHHMQLSDDSLDMTLRVGDIRTHVIRVVSKKDGRQNSSDIIEKESENRSRDGAVQSAYIQTKPSSSKTTQIHSSNGKTLMTALEYNVKRKAPTPPVSVHFQEQNSESNSTKHEVFNEETRKTIKRRAPSPPRVATKPELSLETKSSDEKPPRPPRPPSLNSPDSNPASPLSSATASDQQTSNTFEKNRDLPVFIPPPPPASPPPPLEECETPVGPIDFDFDEDTVSVEIPSETSDAVDETKDENLERSSTVTDGTEHSNEENLEDKNGDKETIEEKEIQEVSVEKEKKVEKEEKEKKEKKEEKDGEDEKEKKEEEEEKEKKEEKDGEDEKEKKEEQGKPDETDGSVKEEKETGTRTNNVDEKLSEEELKLRESLQGLNQEQLQMLLNAQKSGGGQTQQLPYDLQNRQYFAMHQRQQILQNLLIQQMLEQQMAHQTTTSMLPMNLPQPVTATPIPYVAGPHMQSVGGAVPHMNSGNVVPMQTFTGNMSPMQYLSSTSPPVQALPPKQSVGTTPPVQAPDGSLPLTQSVVAVLPVQSVSDDPPVQPVGVDSIKEKMEEKPEESIEFPPAAASIPPVKDEELVNRPLFKRMLAQVSQEKLKGIPNASSAEGSNGKSSVSPSARIEKIPSTYVESAGKNNYVIKANEERKSPVVVSHSGRKSSYVESAIDRNKVAAGSVVKDDEKTVPVALSLYSTTKSSKLQDATDRHKFDSNQENVPIIEDISSPTEENEKKVPASFSHSGKVSSYADSAQRKTLISGAEKPKFQRQMSQPATVTKPKPVIGPKPVAIPIRRSKTLPKTKKEEPLKISLNPEERLMVSSFASVSKVSDAKEKLVVQSTSLNVQNVQGTSLNVQNIQRTYSNVQNVQGTTSNVQNVQGTTSNVQNNHNVNSRINVQSNVGAPVRSKLNVVEPEMKTPTVLGEANYE